MPTPRTPRFAAKSGPKRGSGASRPAGPGGAPRSTARAPQKPASTGEGADRLQKMLARAGLASRRAGEELILAGRVRVNGKVVTELGAKADPRSKTHRGRRHARLVPEAARYLVLHKPRGVVSTLADPEGRPTVVSCSKARAPASTRWAGSTSPPAACSWSPTTATSPTACSTRAGGVPKTYVVKIKGLMTRTSTSTLGARASSSRTARRCRPSVHFLRHEEGQDGKTWFEHHHPRGAQPANPPHGRGHRLPRDAPRARDLRGDHQRGAPPGEWRYLTKEELTQLKADWGVPKRAVHPPVQEADESREARRPHVPRWVPAGAKGSRDAKDPRDPRDPRDDGFPARGGDASRGEVDRGGPRYGGGAPVRRDVSITEDWGGGVKRGSSRNRATRTRRRGAK